ncbi:MAG: cbb3-type cytochrome c oxidase subunit 3 [Litorimonas sp.]
MGYDQIAHVVKVGGTVAFTAVFVAAIFYALWPKNKDRFDRAARMPLDADDEPKMDAGDRQ